MWNRARDVPTMPGVSEVLKSKMYMLLFTVWGPAEEGTEYFKPV